MNADVVLVKMAEMAMAGNSTLLKTTLGSCVAVVMHDPKLKIGGLAHIMLPQRLREDEALGKYAETAIPHLLSRLLAGGCSRRNLRALLTGGANMFRYSGDRKITTIGEKNVDAAKRILEKLEIPITYEDTGGEQGRTVLFNSHSGEIRIHTLSRMKGKGAAQ
jgi:chemotaxis protein CheD